MIPVSDICHHKKTAMKGGFQPKIFRTPNMGMDQVTYIPHRIHGAGIYANMTGVY